MKYIDYIKTTLLTLWAFQQKKVRLEDFIVSEVTFKALPNGRYSVTTTYGMLDKGQSEAESKQELAVMREGMDFYNQVMEEGQGRFDDLPLNQMMMMIAEGRDVRRRVQ